MRLFKKLKTAEIEQSQSTECGVVALAIILEYYGYDYCRTTLRKQCQVSRDGVNILALMNAAKIYGLKTEAFQVASHELRSMQTPAILFWQYNHFVILEYIDGNEYYLNDPCYGKFVLPHSDMKKLYSGIVIECIPQSQYKISLTKRYDCLFGKVTRSIRLLKNLSLLLHDVFGALKKKSYFFFCSTLCTVAMIMTQNLLFTFLIVNQSILSLAIIMPLGAIYALSSVTGIIHCYYFNSIFTSVNAHLVQSILKKLLQHIFSLGQASLSLTNNHSLTNLCLAIQRSVIVLSNSIKDLIVHGSIFCLHSLLLFYIDVRIAVIINLSNGLYFLFNTATLAWLSGQFRLISAVSLSIQTELYKLFSISHWLQSYCCTEILKAKIFPRIFNLFQITHSYNSRESLLQFAEQLLFVLKIFALFSDIHLSDMQRYLLLFLITLQHNSFMSLCHLYKQWLMQKPMLQKLNDEEILKPRVAASNVACCSNIINCDSMDAFCFDNLSYRYQADLPNILDSINFRIKKHEKIVLIGESGCGKTTLLKLLTGLIRPVTGHIKYGYHFHEMGYIAQDTLLLPNDLLLNIQFFAPTLEKILPAWLPHLPSHGETARLSLSDKQLILLGRLLVNPTKCLILDEALSAFPESLQITLWQHLLQLEQTIIYTSHCSAIQKLAHRSITLPQLT